jgi:predicted alpha-1,6-mannanase (GH76 family)
MLQTYKSYNWEIAMKSTHSMVISMRLPAESGKRLKRMAKRHGWTPSDASARLVEEGLRRSEFGFIDFRDSPAGRQAYLQGSTLAVWEVMLLVRS